MVVFFLSCKTKNRIILEFGYICFNQIKLFILLLYLKILLTLLVYLHTKPRRIRLCHVEICRDKGVKVVPKSDNYFILNEHHNLIAIFLTTC